MPVEQLLLYFLLFVQYMKLGCNLKDGLDMSCNHIERKALLMFKESLTDKSNRLSSWMGEDCCTWEGVGYSKIAGNRVVKLDLHNPFPFDPSRYSYDTNYAATYTRSCLGGELNRSLLELKHLQYLDLSMNNFSGIQIPIFFGSLRNLRYLDLSSAGFDGMILHHLGNLSNLEFLNLGDGNLGWGLDAGYRLTSKNLLWVAQLSSLKSLDLSGAHIGKTTDWLSAINMLSTLKSLNLAGCNLDTLPPLSHLNFTSLSFLDLQGNSFNSIIPLWLFNLTSLTNLHLAGNLFHGPIPNIISQLPSLTVLDLFSNDMSSSLPKSLCNLSSLSNLYLQFNHFQGLLSHCLGKLTSLKELILNSNDFSGTVPLSLGQLANLQRLCLSNNQFTGVLTEHLFSNLTEIKVLRISSTLPTWNVSFLWVPPFQLQYIDLKGTKVGPQFPSWLRTQTEVETLLMSHASISDILPDWFEIVYSQINYLDLTDNEITGKLPKFKESGDEFNRCILLYSNKFEGPLNSFPIDAVAIDISRNLVTGSIPLLDGNATMPNLRYLTISDNLLTGGIPEYICNLQALYFIDLSDNQLSGSIPPCLGSLRYLRMLNLGNNSFSGRIPNSLGNMEFLTILQLNENKFEGGLPTSMQNLKNLEVLDLGGNRLKGIIPAWIGIELSNLRILRLQSNHFSGNITLQLCHLSNLQVLNLACNKLVGIIPCCFNNFSAMVSTDTISVPFTYTTALHPSKLLAFMKGRYLEYSSNLPLLKSLGLSENNFVGEIPNELMDLAGLKALNLSENHLKGRIPEMIGNLKYLESLDLARNELFGSIPQSLSTLNFLSFLDLSFNNLSGRIPSGEQLQTLDDPSIYKGNYGLCGKPLSKICLDPNDSSRRKGPVHHQTGGKESTFLWSCAGFGPGFAVGLVGFLSILVFKKPWRHAYFRLIDNVCNRIWIGLP